MVRLLTTDSTVNGVPYLDFINSNPFFKNVSEILVFSNKYGVDESVEDARQIRKILNTDINLDALEAGKQYEVYLQEQSSSNKQLEISNTERITALETENAEINYALMMGGLL